MTEDKFYLKFTGQRFGAHTLPISVLHEFEIFQRLVEFEAAARWRKFNPAKKRLPKGFSRAFELGISAVKEGSAAAELVPVKKSGLFSEQELEDAIRATSSILKSPELRSGDGDANSQFRRIIRMFGSTLQEGEVISLSRGTPQSDPLFQFDQASRRRLIRAFSSETERTVSSVGKLVGVKIDDDWSKGKLEIASGAFGHFNVVIDPDIAKSEFDGALHSYMRFSVVAEMALDQTIKRVFEVDQIELSEVTTDDVTGELRKLVGFVDPDVGKPVSSGIVAACEKFLTNHLDVADRANVFPGSEGNILIEFELNEWDVTLEITESGQVEFYGYHLGDEDDASAEFFRGFRSLEDGVYEALLERERETW